MADILATQFSGTLTLTAASGCTLTGTATITNVRLNRADKDVMTGEIDFIYDGAVTRAWNETGTAADLYGTGGGVSAPSGFNMQFNGWSASIEVGTSSYTKFGVFGTFNKPTNSTVRGTARGIVQHTGSNTAPVPAT